MSPTPARTTKSRVRRFGGGLGGGGGGLGRFHARGSGWNVGGCGPVLKGEGTQIWPADALQ